MSKLIRHIRTSSGITPRATGNLKGVAQIRQWVPDQLNTPLRNAINLAQCRLKETQDALG
jgi:hypothetical protein